MKRWLAELTRRLMEIYLNQRLIYVMIDNGPDVEPEEVFAGYCKSVLMVQEGALFRYWLTVREPGGTFIMTERVEWLNLKWNKQRDRWEATKTKGKPAQPQKSPQRRIFDRGSS